MKWIVIVLCVPAGLLVLAFIGMVIHDVRHPYRPSRAEVRATLQRVLDGTMTWQEWDNFTHIPIKDDPFLESIRTKCEEMETGEFVHRDDPKLEEKWVYNDKGLEIVKGLVHEIEGGIEQGGGEVRS